MYIGWHAMVYNSQQYTTANLQCFIVYRLEGLLLHFCLPLRKLALVRKEISLDIGIGVAIAVCCCQSSGSDDVDKKLSLLALELEAKLSSDGVIPFQNSQTTGYACCTTRSLGYTSLHKHDSGDVHNAPNIETKSLAGTSSKEINLAGA